MNFQIEKKFQLPLFRQGDLHPLISVLGWYLSPVQPNVVPLDITFRVNDMEMQCAVRPGFWFF